MKKYLTLLLAAAAVLSCQPKANFLLDNCPEIHDLESGALLSPRQARKAPGCYGVVHTRLFDSQQTISFVRYRPESFSTTIVTAEREDADRPAPSASPAAPSPASTAAISMSMN